MDHGKLSPQMGSKPYPIIDLWLFIPLLGSRVISWRLVSEFLFHCRLCDVGPASLFPRIKWARNLQRQLDGIASLGAVGFRCNGSCGPESWCPSCWRPVRSRMGLSRAGSNMRCLNIQAGTLTAAPLPSSNGNKLGICKKGNPGCCVLDWNRAP